jgi:hypothetical protein
MTTPSAPTIPIRDLVALATRAPSVHNTQPWHWCVAGDRVSLFADNSRQLQYADPDGRDLVISCGAALHHLQVAAAAASWKTRVRRMPNPYNDAQLANISFRPEEPTPEALAALDALVTRRTDRRRPSSWPVPRERLDGLLALGQAAGVTIVGVVSQRARAELLQILAEAEKAQRLTAATSTRSSAGPHDRVMKASRPPACCVGYRRPPPTSHRPGSLRNTDGPRTRSGAHRARAARYLHLIRRHRVAAPGR